MAFPEPESQAQMCTTASVLRQCLERELVHFEDGLPAERIKDIFDAIYLPRLIALSHQANRFVEYQDWQLLCQPLQKDLVATQLLVVTEVLDLIVSIINPLGFR
ncbi:MAG TPA: hypothetical protein VKU19_07490 [Bryobacteraceae bacterium]|nr:hypothetical protein [Bryobacteraceae bacterium]